jgi:hypothetical protein
MMEANHKQKKNNKNNNNNNKKHPRAALETWGIQHTLTTRLLNAHFCTTPM